VIFRTRYVVALGLAAALAVAGGCGSNEDDDQSAPADTTTTTRVAAPATSALSTVRDVLASRIREEFPGVYDTQLSIGGGTLTVSFDVGPEEKPGGPADFARLAAGELATVAPEVLRGAQTVEVRIAAADGQVTAASFELGALIPRK
jgi:hypothetical protein